MRTSWMLIVMLLMLSGGLAYGVEEAVHHDPSPGHALVAEGETTASHSDAPHPVGPEDPTWSGAMVIVIIGTFVAAAAVGIVVRANASEEVPDAHSHDDEHHGHHDDDDHHHHENDPGRSSHH